MTAGAVKTVFLVRCQAFDMGARHVATALAGAGAQVVVVVDERRAVADTAPFAKIAITDQVLADLGLAGLPHDWGWLCGDVWYYAAAPHLPDATHLCLVESDVAFAGDAAAQFVRAVADDPTDLLAAELGRRDRVPKFSAGLTHLGLDPQMACFFPLTRCSTKAVATMRALREKSIATGVANVVNDEAILVGALQAGSYTASSLTQTMPHLFDTETFFPNPPMLAEAIARGAMDTAVLHPVIPLAQVVQKIASGQKKYTRHGLRRVLRMANAQERAQVLDALAAKEAADALPQDRFAHLARGIGLAAPIKVLDVGANPLIEGDAAYVPLLRAGLAQVFGFEPQEDALTALNARKSPDETYFGDAVGDGGPATLHVYRAQGFTSLFMMDPDSTRYLGFRRGTRLAAKVDLVTRRLDDIADLPAVDLLKIDVQGAELQIIIHGREKLAQALVVITEARMFPIYRDEPFFGDLERELAAQGFYFLRFATLKHVPVNTRHRDVLHRSAAAQAVDGDAVFVRDLRHLARFSDDALRRLAVLADGVIDSPDLTLRVLELLEDRGLITPDVISDYIARLPAAMRR